MIAITVETDHDVDQLGKTRANVIRHAVKDRLQTHDVPFDDVEVKDGRLDSGLVEHEVIAEADANQYKQLITDAGLEAEFQDVWGVPLAAFELGDDGPDAPDPVVHETLDAADESLLLTSWIASRDERLRYRVFRIGNGDTGSPDGDDTESEEVSA